MVDPARRIVFVLGPGRSGTSTMAGALAHSGYEVPNAIMGNDANPSGFFEPRWVVNFHRESLRQVDVRTLDTEPGAFDRMEAVTSDPVVRDRLRTWLQERLARHDRLVIKDPRMVWFRDLWVSVTADLGVEPGFIVMLRHPSEVSSSRSAYYNVREVTGVAGWVNVALMTEKLTAGLPRALVHYPELTADWRSQLIRLRDDLDLDLDPAPEDSPHPVDDFIDPGLRRMRPGWENITVPAFLQDLGERTFESLSEVAEDGATPERTKGLDGLRAEYAQLHEDAAALVASSVKRGRGEIRKNAARRARTRARQRFEADRTDRAPEPPSSMLHRLSRRLPGRRT